MRTLIRYAMTALMLATFALCSLAQEEKKEGGDNPSAEAPQGREAQEKSAILADLPSSLEEMLAHALKSNPDILVAEADLYHAQAVVKQVRLQVSHALVDAFLQRKARKENLEIARKRYSDMQARVEGGRVNADELYPLRQELTAVEAELAEIEAMLRGITGLDPASGRKLGTLEEALELALQSSGEIVLAEADLVRMDTRLNRMRLQVTEEVTITFQERRTLEYALDGAHRAHHRAQERVKQGVVPEEERMEAFQHLIEVESELIRIEAHLRYLLGIGMKVRAR